MLPDIQEFTPASVAQQSWQVVVDGVMGGLSQGRFTIKKPGVLHFSGTLSLENNGGFSSIRSQRLSLDLSQYQGLRLRVRGDGRTYQLRLASDARFRGREVAFSADFATEKGKWVEIEIPFSQFKGSFRGIKLPSAKLKPASIQRLGLMIADKQAGEFSLEVDWIRPLTQ